MKKLIVFIYCLFTCLYCIANVTMSGIFGNDMVLQRNKPIAIWGWAQPNEKIVIQFKKQVKSVIADAKGNWSVKLSPESAGGPFYLKIKGKNTITFSNVLVGEVWICSGQSNMEWQLQFASNATEEIASSNFSQIRHLTISKAVSAKPQRNIKGGEWKICNTDNSSVFTAVGYFFAKQLYQKLKVPIGLINNAWAGTHVETWTSRHAFENSDEFKNMINEMPLLNMDSINQIRVDRLSKKAKIWQEELIDKKLLKVWVDKNFNASKWNIIITPGLWESQELEGLDGVVLFRKIFVLDASDIQETATIQLAKIDDNDITYLNGIKIGNTEGYMKDRRYVLPKGLLKVGENVLAVRVDDTGGGGGFHGDESEMNITIGKKKISLAGTWHYKIQSFNPFFPEDLNPNAYPTLLFNAMLSPIIPYTIQGVIWYQGESNANRAYQYRKAFPLMINDWRQHWKQGDFPFYFVQLSSYSAGGQNSPNEWAELREAQANALSLINTGMAVTTDIGVSNDIHPKNKKDVGNRLAAIALKNTYQKQMVADGPTYQSMRVENNRISIYFSKSESKLVARDKYGYLKGFKIASSDQKFYLAKALIEGNKIIVFSDQVPNPVAVRYSWTDDAGESNLFNKDGFPAAPFRTDNWQLTTINEKFKFK